MLLQIKRFSDYFDYKNFLCYMIYNSIDVTR